MEWLASHASRGSRIIFSRLTLYFTFKFCFVFRYKVLLRGKKVTGNNSDCTLLLEEFDAEKQSFKLGNTKVIYILQNLNCEMFSGLIIYFSTSQSSTFISEPKSV